MERTLFAGLTALEADESVYDDGASFLWRNPQIVDALLKLGATTHRHDAHAATPDPLTPAQITLTDAGFLPPATTFYVGYTVIDGQGGETRVSPLASATTPAAMAAPGLAPTAALSSGGTLGIGPYYYAATRLDDAGGETEIGPQVLVNVTSASKVTLSNLNAVRGPADHLAIYKSNGGEFYYVGDAYGDTFTDDGTPCVDCLRTPPITNTTVSNAGLDLIVPLPLPSGATRVRVYGSQEDGLVSPALLFDVPFDDPRVASGHFTFDRTVYSTGSPPPVSLSKPGANKIDPDTELIQWHWKRPVAASGLLPSTDDLGDIRLTLNNMQLWAMGSGGWNLLNLVATGPPGPPGPIGASGVQGVQGVPGLGTDPRDQVTIVTPTAVAPNTNASGTVALGKSFRLLRVVTNRPIRLRLYSSLAKQAADLARAQGTDPTGDHGLICEVISAAGFLALSFSPEPTGSSQEAVPTVDIPYTITNLDSSSGIVTVNLTRQQLEQ